MLCFAFSLHALPIVSALTTPIHTPITAGKMAVRDRPACFLVGALTMVGARAIGPVKRAYF